VSSDIAHTYALKFDANNGSVSLPARANVIHGGMSQSHAEAALGECLRDRVDHANGYTWSNFHGLQLGGMPCVLSLGFHHAALTELHLSVSLPDAELAEGWPTRATIDAALTFMRRVFTEQFGREFGEDDERFDWGLAWCGFDAKACLASAGIRYHPIA
jgi:hypothetical protein